MARAHVEGHVPASADYVWALIEDFSDITAWAMEGMSVSRSEGSGVGALRWIESPQGQFVERCESHDAAARRFTYSIVEGPAQLKSYLVAVSVEPDGDESTITWTCDFEMDGVLESDAVAMIESSYRNGFIPSLLKTVAASHESGGMPSEAGDSL